MKRHPLKVFADGFVLGDLFAVIVGATIHRNTLAEISGILDLFHTTDAICGAAMPNPTRRSIEKPAIIGEDERPEVGAIIVPTLEQAWEKFVDSVIAVESSGNPNAVNTETGARGLMQIMEPTWRDMCHEPWSRAFEPDLNRTVGSAYLRWCRSYVDRRSGRKATAVDILCCYHGGVGNYEKAGWSYDGMGPRTQEYVGKVLAELDRRIDGKEAGNGDQ